MSNETGRWSLEGFPDRVGGVPSGVEKAYTAWLESCKTNPKRRGQRLQSDGVRYTAEVPSAVFADASGGWKLMCDYDVFESDLSQPGRAVFVEMGFAPGDVLTE